MALLRPSELARVWALHPRTVYLWIREGKLPAIKTPGAQYRVRSDDARAYCEAHGLQMPRGIKKPAGTVVVVGKGKPSQRAIVKACKTRSADVVAFTSALDGLLAIANDRPDVLALDAACDEASAADVVRAIRGHAATASLPIVVYDASPRAAALAEIGVTWVIGRGRTDELRNALAEALDVRLTPAARAAV